MLQTKLNEIKKLIKRERQASSNPQRPRYSQQVRDGVISLAKEMTVTDIARELGVAKSFIHRLKNTHSIIIPKVATNESREVATPIKLMEISNCFVKDIESERTPAVKFSMPNGVVIELFA